MRYVLPMIPKALAGLVDLALDLRWSWSHSSDELWRKIHAELWDSTHNPTYLLHSIPQTRLEQLAEDPEFLEMLDRHVEARRQTLESESWFDKNYAQQGQRLGTTAYFSMEFGLAEALPIYSGGLGILAGDFLKTASDIGVPMIGIGILWQQGYFRQMLDAAGNQIEVFPYNDPGQLPVMPLRDNHGQWVTVKIGLPHREVLIRAWQVTTGRTRLLLLDTNDAINTPADRGITSDLYGGGSELRLQQELVLGIGGWRLLRALGIQPDICHLNEGHAAFAVLERARGMMVDRRVDFHTALTATRAGNLFTTHTPVEAGFDRFSRDLIEQYLGSYVGVLGIGMDELLALGRASHIAEGEAGEQQGTENEPFNMAYLAIHGSGGVNGVSRLHGDVSRKLFQPLFPRWPHYEIPVGHVTNGVHVPSWDSAIADDLWTKYCGKDRWLDGIAELTENFMKVTDEELWGLREASRKKLIEDARRHVARQGPIAGSLESLALDVRYVCNPSILTLGFARRFTSYKRVNLLLHDPDRLERLLCGDGSRVQLVLAGKAHPADTAGKAMIKEWTDFIRLCDVRRNVLFLVDYDMDVAEHLVHGVDVWINTPRRPWEASGTSGMKVLVNGGVNLSELDGWWAEAYTPDVGWALGDGLEHDNDPKWDAAEAERLYDLIENVLIPEFYDRDEKGIPRKWIARVRNSMAQLTPQFSANRMLEQYLSEHYIPAAAAYHRRSGFSAAAAGETMPAAIAVELQSWGNTLAEHWDEMSFQSFTTAVVVSDQTTAKGTPDSGTAGSSAFSFEVQVELGGMPADAVHVELFAEPLPATEAKAASKGELPLPEVHVCCPGPCIDIKGKTVCKFAAVISTARPATDFTPRIVPYHSEARVPLEANYILWYR